MIMKHKLRIVILDYTLVNKNRPNKTIIHSFHNLTQIFVFQILPS